MPILPPEYLGQPGIEAVQAPNPRLTFAAIVAAAAHERIGLVHRSLVKAGVSAESGVTGEISEPFTFPLPSTDKDISLIPVIHQGKKPRDISGMFDLINKEIDVQIPVAVRYLPLESDSRRNPQWLLLGGRHDWVKTSSRNGRTKTTRRVHHYDAVYPLRGVAVEESASYLHQLVRNSLSPFTLNAVGIDIIGHEHPDHAEQ